MRALFAMTLLCVAACGPDLPPPAASAAGGGGEAIEQKKLDLTGNYRCTIEGIDTTVHCGGPVYRSDLRGSSRVMTIAQTGERLQIGAFEVTLDGSLYAERDVRASYADHACTNCGSNPVRLELTATAGEGRLSDVRVELSQLGTGYSDCEKSYRGVCARDGQ